MARRLIARAWLGAPSAEATLGEFTLHDAQREAVRRIVAACDRFGGALLADPPGTGKTIIALAVARDSGESLVVAPAALRGHWARFAERAAVPVRFVSLERLSAGHLPARAQLIIVDEAHQARTPGTVRYRRLAELCAGARVLLLTATPVVNRIADRDALLALFLGARGSTLAGVGAAACVIRRESDQIPRPALRRIPALQGASEVAHLAEGIAMLPDPLSIEGARPATALIRLSLALAWQSSLAALDVALRRRIQRGAALRDLIDAGRVPTRAALRHFFLGEQETQLAFPGIVADLAGADPGGSGASIEHHLEAVRALRRLIAPHIADDIAARAEAITALRRSNPGARIVLFARHAETVRSLHRALRRESGVVAVTGTAVRAAAGRWRREEVLRSLGPERPPGTSDPRRGITLLLTTDLLSEGIELQAASIIIHADRPWTPARLAQRRGRLARAGSSHDEVMETHFAPPPSSVSLLQIAIRHARKRRAASQARGSTLASEGLRSLMREWSRAPAAGRATVIPATVSGFIAAIRQDGRVRLLGARQGSSEARRLLPFDDARSLLALGRCTTGEERTAPPDELSFALRALRRILRAERTSSAAGDAGLGGRDILSRLTARFSEGLAAATSLERASLAARQRESMDLLGARVEAGIETALRDLLAGGTRGSDLLDRLEALLRRFRSRPSVGVDPAPLQKRARVIAILLLKTSAPLAPGSATTAR